MTNRLPYETAGGMPSTSVTFEQLREYVTKAEEDCKTLSRHAAQRKDAVRAAQYRTVAAKLHRVAEHISHLGNTRTRSGVGYVKSN